MKKIYFLDGLGSNQYYANRLKQSLENQKLELVYLALPGHPDNLNCNLNNLSDFQDWFENQLIEDSIILMGFSLGADFACYLAHHSTRVKQLILLDGGYWDLSDYPLEQELQDSLAYINSQITSDIESTIQQETKESYWNDDLRLAINQSYHKIDNEYHLNLNLDTILQLLVWRRDSLGLIKSPTFKTNTLLLISGQPKESLVIKEKLIQELSDYIQIVILPHASHNMYLEYPNDIANHVQNFVKNP